MAILWKAPRSSKAPVLVVLVLLTLSSYLFSPFQRTRRFDIWSTDDFQYGPEKSINASLCSVFGSPSSENVQIILKTGTVEAYDKLPVHLSTVLSCVPPSNLLVYSDLDEKVESWTLHDALATLPKWYKTNNPDFKVYFKQKHYRKAGKSPKALQGGWTLDKYKFLPMIRQAFEASPKKQWYFFLEADTFVVWDNLFRWIAHQDPSKPLYLGSPVWPKDKPIFAHGGSGFVLSHEALRILFAETPRAVLDKPEFGIDMQKECCGDEVLARVLRNVGIKLHGYWPMFNGEKPSTVRFGDEQWCEPVMTLHHLSAEDTTEVWAWLKHWSSLHDTPLLFADLFFFVEPYLAPARLAWDNLSEDVSIAVSSPKATPSPGVSMRNQELDAAALACKRACDADTRCMQYNVSDEFCRLGYSIRLGGSTASGNEAQARMRSGWNMERIRRWTENKAPCGGAHWVRANP